MVMPAALAERLATRAEQRGLSVSELLSEYAEEGLRRDPQALAGPARASRHPGAMAAVILRVDHETGLVQRPGHVVVAPRMLAHPVRELDRGPRLARRILAVGDDLRAVG